MLQFSLTDFQIVASVNNWLLNSKSKHRYDPTKGKKILKDFISTIAIHKNVELLLSID